MFHVKPLLWLAWLKSFWRDGRHDELALQAPNLVEKRSGSFLIQFRGRIIDEHDASVVRFLFRIKLRHRKNQRRAQQLLLPTRQNITRQSTLRLQCHVESVCAHTRHPSHSIALFMHSKGFTETMLATPPSMKDPLKPNTRKQTLADITPDRLQPLQ